MGTHCALVVKRNGKIVLDVERTMDGYILRDLFENWVQELIETGKEPFDWSTRSGDIGTGAEEYGDEREHQQEYFLGINYDTKTIFTTPDMYLSYDVEKSISKLQSLLKRGWHLRIGYDTEDVE